MGIFHQQFREMFNLHLLEKHPKILVLYSDTLIIGHTVCSMISIQNELSLQKEI